MEGKIFNTVWIKDNVQRYLKSLVPTCNPVSNKLKPLLLSLAMFSYLTPLSASGGGPFILSYGGRLATPLGDAVKGPVDIEIKFFREASGGTALPVSPIIKRGVPLNDGVFQFDITELSSAEVHLVFTANSPTWVEAIDLTNRVVYPRQKLMAVPYAFKVPTDNSSVTFDSEGRLTVSSIPLSKVTGLETALGQKTDTSKTYSITDISGLTAALADKASTTATLTGDVSGTLNATSVSKIRGYTVAAPSGSDSYLKYDGSTLVWSSVPGSTPGSISDSQLATISTAGKVSGSAINTGTISGTTAISTTGTITAKTIVSTPASALTPTGTTQTIDFSTSNNQILNLGSATGNVTLTLSGAAAGGTYIMVINQGATPRTVTWPAGLKWKNGVVPTLSGGNSADIVTLFYDGTNYYGLFNGNFQ